MTTQRHFPALVALMILFLSAATTADFEEENWHQVEVIIFAQQDDFNLEASPLDPKLAYPARITFLDEAEQLYPQVADNAPLDQRLAALMVPRRFLTRARAKEPVSFVPLESSERQLNPDAYTLRRNNSYRVLFHSAWRQPVSSRKSSEWLVISGGDRFGDHRELEGALRLYQSRFYHLETNLWLSRFERKSREMAPQSTAATANQTATPQLPAIRLPPVPETPPSPALKRLRAMAMPGGELEPLDEFGSGALPEVTGFDVASVDVLQQSQQIRRKQIHYIDHPRMGILVLLTPLSNAGEEDSEEL